jgi:hypothetical protein
VALPSPFYQDALVTIYQGDCRDLLPEFAPLSFSTAMTDPPHRDGDVTLYGPLMAQVRPLMAAVAVSQVEMTHMLPVLGKGQNRDNVVASLCTFLINGVLQAPNEIADPDMKLPGWATIFGLNPLGTIDPFCGAGGWILLAAKRAGQRAVGIELDAGYCAQSAARIAAG